jgi:hypothetical protein
MFFLALLPFELTDQDSSWFFIPKSGFSYILIQSSLTIEVSPLLHLKKSFFNFTLSATLSSSEFVGHGWVRQKFIW